MKKITKIFLSFLLTCHTILAAAHPGVSVCLKGDNYQNGTMLRTFDLTMNGTARSQTENNIPLQTATAWMSVNFNVTRPKSLIVMEPTNGSAMPLCNITNLPSDTQWVGVTISYAPNASTPCLFTFSNTVPDPACSNKQ